MTDDGRGADVITLPVFNLSPPDGGHPDDGVPPPPEAGDLAPPPDFFLPFATPGDDDDASTTDPDDVALQMVADASSGTGTPARATASMTMVTMAAIAVAALRGTWSVANFLRARREHHDAVADQAREAAGKQKGANAAKKAGVQSSSEFGRGAAGKGGGRGGSSGGSAGGGSGRGTFGQQKPAPKGGARGSSASGSTGAGSRGAGPKNGPSSSGASAGGRHGAGGSNGSGSSGRGSKGAGGTGSSGSGSSRGSTRGAKKSPGTLGQLATGRQQRKNDQAKADRAAEADLRKADLADRGAARKEATAEAADRRKRKAERRKARLEREKAAGTDPKDTKEKGPKAGKDGDAKKVDRQQVDLKKKPKTGKDGDAKNGDGEKVDLKKKPKAGDGTTEAKKDDAAEKVDLTKQKPDSSKGGAKAKKQPKAPGTKTPRAGRRKPKGTTTGPKTRTRWWRRKGRHTTETGSMPGGDGEWLRPPPGWDVEYSVTIERESARPQRRQPAGDASGRQGLPAGRSGGVTPTRSVRRESPIVMGTALAVGEADDTQYVDAELTLSDLIESDEAMGEEILQGVDHMLLVASQCEGLKSGLEALYATCLEKKVPGVLTRWAIRLMERAGSVQDKAEGLAKSLPTASEAILAARDTAIAADKLRADRVKEAGHTAPAEREYHDRSGA